MSPLPPPHHLVSVYEAVNETTREVYLGLTDKLSPELAEEFARRPPKPVRRWRPEHRVVLRYLVYSIPRRAGEALVRKFPTVGKWRAKRVLLET